MTNYDKLRINPIDYIEKNIAIGIDYIQFDEKLTKPEADFYIIRQQSHNGTYLFTRELINEALSGIVNRTSFCKLNMPKEGIKAVKYTLGSLKIATVFGNIKLN
jgi:hypothetical protein